MKSKKPVLTEAQLLEQILDRLDKLILLNSLQGKKKNEQVKYLAALGYSNSDMAMMLATPKGTIDGIRAEMKKGVEKE